MSSDNNLNSFIGLVVNENLAQAKEVLTTELQQRLSDALEAKFEEYAPTLFEKWDAEKADKNKDGTVSDWEKASTGWASKGKSKGKNNVGKDEEQPEEEEESETEDEEDEEDAEDEETEED